MISINEVEFCINDYLKFFNIFIKFKTDDHFKYFVKTDSDKKFVYSINFIKISLSRCVMYSNKLMSLKMLKIESV